MSIRGRLGFSPTTKARQTSTLGSPTLSVHKTGQLPSKFLFNTDENVDNVMVQTVSPSPLHVSQCLRRRIALCVHVSVVVTQSCLTLCDPMECSPSGSSVHGVLQAKNTGVGCHSLPQGIFLTQGSNPGLLHCRQILYQLRHLLNSRINY